MKKITVKKTKAYWLYIALGIVTLIFGILLLPFWGSIWNECPWKSWGTDLVMLFMAIPLTMPVTIGIIRVMMLDSNVMTVNNVNAARNQSGSILPLILTLCRSLTIGLLISETTTAASM